jgi:hypothetical protein
VWWGTSMCIRWSPSILRGTIMHRVKCCCCHSPLYHLRPLGAIN